MTTGRSAEPPPAPVLQLDGVSKTYELWRSPTGRARAAFRRTVGALLLARPPVASRRDVHLFQALQPCSLSVERGEAVALIGRNGSGKSTLLQIVAGTLAPTTGTVRVNGRVGALLELGSGFNPEFTGRENAMLHASVLGIPPTDALAKFPEIAAFAEIGDFMDVPVKAYSSGMAVRLAFAVQTAFLPDLFIVDEALAVGDAFFQRKCFDRIERFLASGGTLLFVSHDTGLVQRICSRAILLDQGRVLADGRPADVVKRYYQLAQGDLVARPERTQPLPTAVPDRSGDQWPAMALKRDWVSGVGGAYIESFSLLDRERRIRTGFRTGEEVHCRLVVRFSQSVDSVHVGIGFRDPTGILHGGLHNHYVDHPITAVKAGDGLTIDADIRLDLPPGDYLLLLGVARPLSLHEWQDLYSLWDCARVEVTGPPGFWGKARLAGSFQQVQLTAIGGD